MRPGADTGAGGKGCAFDRAVVAAAQAPGRPIEDELRFALSYLAIRRGIGVLGLALPLTLFLLDWLLLDDPVGVRDSLSAYYHSGARDVFVGVLCVIGYLLMRYLWAERRSPEFVLSCAAGIAVLVVALVPTRRPFAPADCLDTATGVSCTQLQRALGETPAYVVHLVAASAFILALAAMCFLTAAALRVRGGSDRSPGLRRMVAFHRACGVVIVAGVVIAGAGALFDVRLGAISPLWLGEVIAVVAFALSWLVTAHDLRALLGRAGMASPVVASRWNLLARLFD